MTIYNNAADHQVSQYYIVTGGANNILNNVAPGATSGVPVISQGSSAQPVFGTALVAGGGTGLTSLSSYAIICGGTTGTGAVQTIPPGTSTYILTTNGVGYLPTWEAAPSSAFSWTVTSATSQACLVTNGYFTSAATQATMYLPSTIAVGNEVKLSNIGAGFNVQPATGQTLNFLSQSVTGPSYFQTTSANAAMDMVCSGTNSTWNVVNNEGTFTPSIVNSQLAASLSGSNLLYLKGNGSAWGTGANSSGEFGNNTTTGALSPVATVGGNVYTGISTALYTTIALRNDGTAWTFGNGNIGELGNNATLTSVSSPISVVGGFSFTQVVTCCGNSLDNTCAGLVASTGSCWCWGIGASGVLGAQTTSNQSSPISVAGAHSFIQISFGSVNGYGLKANGQCWSWGSGTGGALGNQSTTNKSSPVSVVGAHSFIQISGGQSNCYGLKIDGSCWSWGNNTGGGLGNLSTTNTSSPVSVVGAHSFIQISAGTNMSCYGLKSNGQVWAWGFNNAGQLGTQNTTSYSSPVSIVGGFSFTKLALAGQDQAGGSMGAWLSNGQLWAWGNNNGILGNNGTSNTSSPVLCLNTP